MPLNQYINRLGGYDLALAGPYQQSNVTWRIFVLPARRPALAATCNRYLNKSGAAYEPYLDGDNFVLLTMLDMQNVTAGDPGLGSMHEIDGAFQMLVKKPGDLFPRVFMPYLWVNNAWPMVTGRDVMGFRKEVASSFTDLVDDDLAQKAGDLVHIEAMVIPNRGGRLQRKRIVDIVGPASGAPPPAMSFMDLLRELAGALAGAELALIGAVLKAVLGKTALSPSVVFLKQLRDAFDQTKACHQQVFEGAFEMPFDKFGGAHFLAADQFTVNIESFASHPVLEELGLSDKGRTRVAIKPTHVLDLSWDFALPLPPAPGGP